MRRGLFRWPTCQAAGRPKVSFSPCRLPPQKRDLHPFNSRRNLPIQAPPGKLCRMRLGSQLLTARERERARFKRSRAAENLKSQHEGHSDDKTILQTLCSRRACRNGAGVGAGGFVCRRIYLRGICAAGAARLRAAGRPGRRLPVEPRLLGVWAGEGYYWVPGVWVRPPAVGLLWTPGYWGWGGSAFLFHEGYWGPHVGFYGGINYGFGYGGVGFFCGRWEGGAFAYNTAVVRVNTTIIHNTYVRQRARQTKRGRAYQLQRRRWRHPGAAVGGRAAVVEREPRCAHRGAGAACADGACRPLQLRLGKRRASAECGLLPAGSPAGAVQSMGAPGTRDGFGNANRVNTRQGNQQSRINNGVNSRQLTPGETRNLENRDSSIHREAQADRAANGGRLNGQERSQINQRQNNVSQVHLPGQAQRQNDAAAGAQPGQQGGERQAQHTEKNNSPHPAEDHPKR